MSIPFRLEHIAVNSFSINEKETLEDVKLGFSTGFAIDTEKRFVILQVKLKVTKEKVTKALFSLKVSFIFDIEKEAWEKEFVDSKFILKKELATHFLVLAVGTLRGILVVKLQNSMYSDFLLPTLNLSDYFKEDIEISNVVNQNEE
jgi:hypothetical protein